MLINKKATSLILISLSIIVLILIKMINILNQHSGYLHHDIFVYLNQTHLCIKKGPLFISPIAIRRTTMMKNIITILVSDDVICL